MFEQIKSFLAGASLLALLAVAPSAAYAQAGAVQRNEEAAGAFASPNAPHRVMPFGVIYESLAAVAGIAGTGEQTLGTYTLPANGMDVVGRHLRITADFQHAANTNAITPKLYFGASALATAANSTSGSAAKLQCDVLKTGASTQQVNCWGLGGAAGVVPVVFSAAGTDTDTAGIVIKATCTGGTSGADCTLSDFFVEYLN